jgi:hypothetical protein
MVLGTDRTAGLNRQQLRATQVLLERRESMSPLTTADPHVYGPSLANGGYLFDPPASISRTDGTLGALKKVQCLVRPMTMMKTLPIARARPASATLLMPCPRPAHPCQASRRCSTHALPARAAVA